MQTASWTREPMQLKKFLQFQRKETTVQGVKLLV